MTAQDLAAIVKGVAPAVLHVVSSAVAPLAVKIASLEARVSSIRDGRDGDKGKDAEPVDLDALARKAADLIPVPTNGKDGEAPDVEEVAKVAALLVPKAKDGQDGKDVDPVLVDMLKAEIAVLREQLAASDLRSADFVKDMREWLSGEVNKALSEIPLPKDGKDGTGVAGALINKEDVLCLTLSDGTVKELGKVAGRDVDMEIVKKLITDEIAKFPVPTNGKDGADGIGFDDLDASFDDGVLIHRYKRGDVVLREYVWQAGTPRYMGVFKEGQTYQAGQAVTWGGSLWIAKSETTAKPDQNVEASRAWQLAVKRGDAGKPGPKGPQGDKGLRGDPGPIGPPRY